MNGYGTGQGFASTLPLRSGWIEKTLDSTYHTPAGGVDSGADWPSDVQGKCPVGCSLLGLLGAFWGPKNAPKRPKMPYGALKMHQNVLKCLLEP